MEVSSRGGIHRWTPGFKGSYKHAEYCLVGMKRMLPNAADALIRFNVMQEVWKVHASLHLLSWGVSA